MPQAVLDDNDGAVHDQPEVERSQAHKVCAELCLQHSRRSDEHCHRDDHRRDQRSAKIPEQQEEHKYDQKRAFREVRRHCPNRCFDQLGPIEHCLRANARRERAIDLFDLGVRRRGHGSAVAPDQHQRGAQDDFAPVYTCAARPQLAS
jgi:hypothetical protein